jgi:hypothetical protein
MAKRLALLFFICIGFQSIAQKSCSVEEYTKQEIAENPLLKNQLDEIEIFTRNKIGLQNEAQRTNRVPDVIKIPVVFHVLYHTPDQNIPAPIIDLMIAALNRDFNKRNSDTTNIPSVFKPLAANMGFEFKPATMDPKGVSTNGIVKKYTPITYWVSDDKMKFNTSYGSDAWDTKSYLNVWICNLKDVLGYGTLPGMDAKKDGVVISLENIIDTKHTTPSVNDFRTIVHEVGHWLNLYHIWGEGYCGDDRVDDTPKQSSYTPGCPSGTRISCGNNQSGDMYMNYMDFTDDVCMNMFTTGQRKRARVLFETGGARNSILHSKGLNASTIEGSQLPDFYPQWLKPQVYPNPATSVIKIYCEYDERWIGRKLQVLDISGKIVIDMIINSKIQQVDISKLNAGIYFIRAEKEEEKLHAKFVKL